MVLLLLSFLEVSSLGNGAHCQSAQRKLRFTPLMRVETAKIVMAANGKRDLRDHRSTRVGGDGECSPDGAVTVFVRHTIEPARPDQNAVFAFSNDGASRSLAFSSCTRCAGWRIDHYRITMKRLVAKDPARLEVWGGRRRSLLNQAMAQTWVRREGTAFQRPAKTTKKSLTLARKIVPTGAL